MKETEPRMKAAFSDEVRECGEFQHSISPRRRVGSNTSLTSRSTKPQPNTNAPRITKGLRRLAVGQNGTIPRPHPVSVPIVLHTVR